MSNSTRITNGIPNIINDTLQVLNFDGRAINAQSYQQSLRYLTLSLIDSVVMKAKIIIQRLQSITFQTLI